MARPVRRCFPVDATAAPVEAKGPRPVTEPGVIHPAVATAVAIPVAGAGRAVSVREVGRVARGSAALEAATGRRDGGLTNRRGAGVGPGQVGPQGLVMGGRPSTPPPSC